MTDGVARISRDQPGFTLLELLVAMILLSMIVAMLMAGLRLESVGLGRQVEHLDRVMELPPVYDFLRSQIADARPVPAPGSTGGAILFVGQPDGLRFVSSGPQSVQSAGLQVLAIAVAAGALRVRWRAFNTDDEDDSAGVETVLLTHVTQARFGYFGIVAPDTQPHWHDSWENLSYLPSLVRLSLTSADGPPIPELTMAPRMAGSLADANPQQDAGQSSAAKTTGGLVSAIPSR